MPTFLKSSAVLAAIALLTSHAAAADDAVPPMSCAQPKIPERFSVAQEDIQYLAEQVGVYVRCVKAYVDARQAAATQYNALLKQEVDAGNTAVKEINEFQTRFNAFRDRHDPTKKQ